MEKFIDLCGAARNAFERYEDYAKDDIDRDIYFFEHLSAFQQVYFLFLSLSLFDDIFPFRFYYIFIVFPPQSLCPEFVPRLKALDASVEDNAAFINKAIEYYDAGLKKKYIYLLFRLLFYFYI